MDDLRKTVGRRLKERRIKKGFRSQKAFAEALGTDQSTVGRWEAGIFLPGPDYLPKIYALLATDQKDLFGLVEPQPEPTASAMAQVIAAQQAEIEALKSKTLELTPGKADLVSFILGPDFSDEDAVKWLKRISAGLPAPNQNKSRSIG